MIANKEQLNSWISNDLKIELPKNSLDFIWIIFECARDKTEGSFIYKNEQKSRSLAPLIQYVLAVLFGRSINYFTPIQNQLTSNKRWLRRFLFQENIDHIMSFDGFIFTLPNNKTAFIDLNISTLTGASYRRSSVVLFDLVYLMDKNFINEANTIADPHYNGSQPIYIQLK